MTSGPPPLGSEAIRMLGGASPLFSSIPQIQEEEQENWKQLSHPFSPISRPFPPSSVTHQGIHPSQLCKDHEKTNNKNKICGEVGTTIARGFGTPPEDDPKTCGGRRLWILQGKNLGDAWEWQPLKEYFTSIERFLRTSKDWASALSVNMGAEAGWFRVEIGSLDQSNAPPT